MSAMRLLARAIDDTLPVVLEAQKHATTASHLERRIRSKLSSLGDIRKHHKLMLEALTSIKSARSMKELSQRVVHTCVSTVDSKFRAHVPSGATVGGTVFAVHQHLPGVGAPAQFNTTDALDGYAKRILCDRHLEWLCQVAEQCARCNSL